MIAARLYDDNTSMKLEDRAASDLGIEGASQFEKTLKQEVARLAKINRMPLKAYKKKYGYSEVNIGLCGTYACTDTSYTGGLHSKYEHWGLSGRYPRIWPTEMRLTEVLCDMEQAGMPVNVEYLNQVQTQVREAQRNIELRMAEALGGQMFNLGSDDEVREFLTKVLKLKLEKKTRNKQYSVDDEVLEFFADSFPLVQDIRDWRTANKIETTYTQSIIDKLDSNNMVHGDLQQVGTATGRLSCKEPNYQNFPNDSDVRAVKFSGKKLKEGGVDPWSLRRAFHIVDSNTIRVFADYSQIELRVLAKYSGDAAMTEAYLQGADIHDMVANELGVTRRLAKVSNFGLAYGLTDVGLSRRAKLPLIEATQYLQRFFKRYPAILAFRFQLAHQARLDGCHWNNMFGRTRRIPLLNSGEKWQQQRGERMMIASAIQGTAAELTKESLVRVSDFIKQHQLSAKLVNTVHDEIQIDVDKNCLGYVVSGTKVEMERYPEFHPIPILVDIETTETNWAEKKHYEGEIRVNAPR
jgi:DNA polymerase-1